MSHEVPKHVFLAPTSRVTTNGLGVVFSFISSSILGLIVLGFSAGLAWVFLAPLVIFQIVLCPICAKQSGYRVTIGIGLITLLAAALIFALQISLTVFSPDGLWAFVWAVTQIPVLLFASKAYREQEAT